MAIVYFMENLPSIAKIGLDPFIEPLHFAQVAHQFMFSLQNALEGLE